MKIARALLLGCAISVAVPAGALAADRQVSKTGANSGNCIASPCLTIGYAVGQAVDGDRVLIGPGEFAESVGVGKRLEIIGARPATSVDVLDTNLDTFVHPSSPASALALRRGGAVRNLYTQGVGGGPSEDMVAGGLRLRADSAASPGFESDPFAYEVTDVVAMGNKDGVETTRAGLQITDVGATGSTPVAPVRVTVRGGEFTGAERDAGDNGSPAIEIENGMTPLPAPEIVLSGITIGGEITNPISSTWNFSTDRVQLRLEDSSVASDAFGPRIGTTDMVVVRSTITSGGRAFSMGDSSLLLENSVVRRDTSGAGVADASALDVRSGADVIARNSTIHSSGAPALLTHPAAGSTVRVELFNSILLRAGAPAESIAFEGADTSTSVVAADHSLVEGPLTSPIGTFSATSPITGNPGFTDASEGDFGLTAGSVLIDAGSIQGIGSGGLDRGGAPRLLDGNGDCVALPDVGAFEFATGAGAPATASIGGPDRVEAKTAASFSGNAAGAWDFGDGASGSGQSVSHEFATPGAYTVSLTVPGSPATCSGVATKQVTVTPNPKPKLSKVSLLRKVFATGKASRKKGGAGTFVRFKLSERASVSLVVQRKQGKRFRKVGSLKLKGKRGKNSKPFAGKLKGTELAPGAYRLVLQATDSAKQKSGKKKLRFTVKG